MAYNPNFFLSLTYFQLRVPKIIRVEDCSESYGENYRNVVLFSPNYE